MTLDLNASYIYQMDRNMINQGSYMNPIVGAYLFPRGNNWDEVRAYEVYDPARKISTQNWQWGEYGLTVQNPYWVNYRNLRENSKNRYMVGAQLSYKVLPCLTLSGRVRFDDSYTKATDKRYAVLSATFLTTQNAVTMVKRTTRRSKSLPTSLHRSTKTSVKIGIYKPTSVAQSTICVTNFT